MIDSISFPSNQCYRWFYNWFNIVCISVLYSECNAHDMDLTGQQNFILISSCLQQFNLKLNFSDETKHFLITEEPCNDISSVNRLQGDPLNEEERNF